MKITSLDKITDSEVSHNYKIKKRLMIPNDQIPHISNFSQATFPPGEIAPSHQHSDMSEVFFIQSGQGEIQVNDNCHIIKPGTCITIEPGDEHELRNTGSENLVVLYFGVIP